ncbi:hypothetical protein [Altererythrobacter sp. TH136]|uniref:hypothetical protein n=1 Tax=Altererythrobacter sp. TH136 TaxID=2067415 RepID=UPI0011625969|nr:hypothetical protein [Altererythrobacter sp. TH136]QDM40327.1 hypothetical protein C0V74_04130 [Altererythrobacter sp. TH136]
MKRFAGLFLCVLAACRPPASDDYVQRIELNAGRGPTVEPTSPQVEGAIWAPGGGSERIVFGKPGSPPYLALACIGTGSRRAVEITRFARTDPRARGMMALVGNGHIARLKIDAEWNGRGWLWRGRYRPTDERLDAFTGTRKLELTIPGAGTLVLQGSNEPGQLIDLCRRLSAPAIRVQPAAILPPG